eukprot:4610183-Amphidinium_carterae.1
MRFGRPEALWWEAYKAACRKCQSQLGAMSACCLNVGLSVAPSGGGYWSQASLLIALPPQGHQPVTRWMTSCWKRGDAKRPCSLTF